MHRGQLGLGCWAAGCTVEVQSNAACESGVGLGGVAAMVLGALSPSVGLAPRATSPTPGLPSLEESSLPTAPNHLGPCHTRTLTRHTCVLITTCPCRSRS